MGSVVLSIVIGFLVGFGRGDEVARRKVVEGVTVRATYETNLANEVTLVRTEWVSPSVKK